MPSSRAVLALVQLREQKSFASDSPLKFDEDSPVDNHGYGKPTTPLSSHGPASITPSDRPLTDQSHQESRFYEVSLNSKELTKNEKSLSVFEDDAEENYPDGLKLGLVIFSVSLAVFCMALDNTILATAIPKITDDFKAISDVGWYGSSYLITICAFQLFFGKLYTFYPIKWVFIITVVIFEVGSAVAGAACDSMTLIIGRAISGIGAAGIFSGGMLILANSVPLDQRPFYTGLVGGTYGIASVAGPLMGGAFTDKLSWRWCLWINLPMGAITVLFILIFYHPSRAAKTVGAGWKNKFEAFDIIGLLTFLPMIVCLLLALGWGGSEHSWNSASVIVPLVIFAVLLVAFIGVQFCKGENATVPPRIFSQRSIAAASWFGFTLQAGYFIFIYYLPIWFQAIEGVSAMESGIRNIPLILSVVIATIITGSLVTWCGYYTPFVILSSILMTIAAGLFCTLTPADGPAAWIGYQIFFGVGTGIGMQQTLMAVQTVLEPADTPVGIAVIMFVQSMGGALFVAVGQNVFTNRLLSHLQAVVPNLDPVKVLDAGATTIQDVIPVQFLDGVKQAYNDSIVDVFYIAVSMLAVSLLGGLLLEWKSVKHGKTETASA